MLEGHYVVTEPSSDHGDAETITIIDGMYGYRESLSNEEFASIWTGYYITREYTSSWTVWLQVAGIAAACSLGLAAWCYRRLRIRGAA